MPEPEDTSIAMSPYEELIRLATLVTDFARFDDIAPDAKLVYETTAEMLQMCKTRVAKAPISPSVRGMLTVIENMDVGSVQDIDMARTCLAFIGALADDELANKHGWDITGRLALLEPLVTELLEAGPLYAVEELGPVFDVEFSGMQRRLNNQYDSLVADGTIVPKPALTLD